MSQRRTYLIAYDICDPRRLARVANELERTGYRLQFSVFTADLSEKERRALVERLRNLVNTKQDDVRFYLVPEPPRGAWRGPSCGGKFFTTSGAPSAALAERLARQVL